MYLRVFLWVILTIFFDDLRILAFTIAKYKIFFLEGLLGLFHFDTLLRLLETNL